LTGNVTPVVLAVEIQFVAAPQLFEGLVQLESVIVVPTGRVELTLGAFTVSERAPLAAEEAVTVCVDAPEPNVIVSPLDTASGRALTLKVLEPTARA
jgi:hypothetical protein